MDRNELIRQLMGTFLDELDEHVESLNRNILALERETRASERKALIQSIYRTVHSLKGASTAVALEDVETACHRVEEILEALRRGDAPLGVDVIRLLFATADALAVLSTNLRTEPNAKRDVFAHLELELDAYILDTLPEVAGGDPDLDDDSGDDVPAQVDDLPPAPLASVSPAPAALAAPVATAEADDDPRPQSGGTVRIAAAKLDGLLTRSSELLVSIRRGDGIIDALDDLAELVQRWHESLLAMPYERRSHARAEDAAAAALLRDTKQHVRSLATALEQLSTMTSRNFRTIEQIIAAVDEEVYRLRLLPFGSACRGLDRTVRDLAKASGKAAALLLQGADVEIDRSVLEGLKAPLLHLVRNAVEHGIEPPEERTRAGKSIEGRITVAVLLRGAQVEVTVADDGRGIDFQRVAREVEKLGMAAPGNPRELIQHLFMSGFSTSQMVTRGSGRGVGLDVVKHELEALHGAIQLFTEPGRGTRFVLSLPLTLSTIRVLLVGVAGQEFALPVTAIVGLVRVAPSDAVMVGGVQTVLFHGVRIPLISLARVLGIRASATVLGSGLKTPAVVVAAEGSMTALVVDELLSEQDIIIKSLGPRIRHVQYVSGGTILQSGAVAMVLNAAELAGAATQRRHGSALVSPPEERVRRILVADDSLTSRTLEKTILENAGYEVIVASDGQEAWDTLRQRRDIDLVVADVEMPRMDGIALTRAVRSAPELCELPVILVTSLSKDEHRMRGLDAGASAYIVKSAFDQTELLGAVKQLV